VKSPTLFERMVANARQAAAEARPAGKSYVPAFVRMAEKARQSAADARPVVTTCPICQGANPCPLHTFSQQMDHRRAIA